MESTMPRWCLREEQVKGILEAEAEAIWYGASTTGTRACGRFFSAGNRTFFSRAIDMFIPAVCK